MENSLPKPRYSWGEALQVAIALSTRALDEVRALARLPGPRGADGPPGRDGFGFDDLSVVYDGERTFALQFQRGDKLREFQFRMPVMIYRGIWREGHYDRGDVVTRDGSAFVALKDTNEKPAAPPVGTQESADSAWRLMAKSGRNGKHGLNGEKGERGPEGRAGRDLTQVGSDGTKW